MQSHQHEPLSNACLASHWNSAAAGWHANSSIIRKWLHLSTDAMMNMADISAGMRVIDVAAGTGDQSLDIAAKVGPGGFVLATDLSPKILAYAEAKATDAGFNHVRTLVADAEDLPLKDNDFDAAVCRLGLMLFPHPDRALAEMHRVLKSGCRMSVLVFSVIEANPCLSIMMSTIFKHTGLAPADPYKPGALPSLGKSGLLAEMMGTVGFRNIVTTRVGAPFSLPSAQHYINFVRSSGAPIVQMMAHLDESARVEAWADIEEKLTAFNTVDGWVGPNELLLATGSK
jgi:ubiquinone/menaquinone biosynthesis C-methylase UbiE